VSTFSPSAVYIENSDIVFVRIRDVAVARTLNLGHWHNIDLDAQGRVVAAEFINATTAGLDLERVPERDTIVRLIEEAAIPVRM